VALAFGWSDGAAVVVTEEAARQGMTVKMRYTLAVSRDGEGNLRIQHTGLEFLEVNGKALTDKARTALAPMLALSGALPDVIVSPDGKLRAVADLDSAAARAVAFVRQHNPAKAAVVERSLGIQPVRDAMKRRAIETWTWWVGAWVGLQVRTGETTKLPRSAGEGAAAADARLTVSRATADRIEMKLESEAKGEEARKAAAEVAVAMSKQMGRDLDPSRIESVESRDEVRVVTDPRTLRPVRVVTQQTSRVSMAGKAPVEQTERHDYRFAWKK
jgi:hypothetical protein